MIAAATHGATPLAPHPSLPTTADTSAAAYASQRPRQQAYLHNQLLELVAGARASGQKDMSLRELQQAWERKHNKRVELSTVSSAVSRLVDAERLLRVTDPRACSVTGRECKPVSLPQQQRGLV